MTDKDKDVLKYLKKIEYHYHEHENKSHLTLTFKFDHSKNIYFSNPQLYKKFYMKDMNTPYEAESPVIE